MPPRHVPHRRPRRRGLRRRLHGYHLRHLHHLLLRAPDLSSHRLTLALALSLVLGLLHRLVEPAVGEHPLVHDAGRAAHRRFALRVHGGLDAAALREQVLDHAVLKVKVGGWRVVSEGALRAAFELALALARQWGVMGADGGSRGLRLTWWFMCHRPTKGSPSSTVKVPFVGSTAARARPAPHTISSSALRAVTAAAWSTPCGMTCVRTCRPLSASSWTTSFLVEITWGARGGGGGARWAERRERRDTRYERRAAGGRTGGPVEGSGAPRRNERGGGRLTCSAQFL